MSLRGIGQDKVILPDTALKLGLKVVPVVGVAVVTDPHLGHPLDVVLNHVALWQRTVPNICVLSSETTFTLQLEVELSIFHVITH